MGGPPDTIRHLIENDPRLAAAIDSLPPGQPPPLEERIQTPAPPMPALPRQVIQDIALVNMKTVVMAYGFSANSACFAIFSPAYFGRISFRIKPTYLSEIRHNDLGYLIKECEKEMDYRGFCLQMEEQQTDANGKIVAKVYTFSAEPQQLQQLEKELSQLIKHFHNR